MGCRTESKTSPAQLVSFLGFAQKINNGFTKKKVNMQDAVFHHLPAQLKTERLCDRHHAVLAFVAVLIFVSLVVVEPPPPLENGGSAAST